MNTPLPDEPLRHNYIKKLVHLYESGALSQDLTHVDVLHDDGCPALRQGYCTCDPDLLIDGRPAGEGSPAAQRRRRRRRKKGRRP